jgi:NO-binding membrane sensor protein with MHYT domain
MSPINPHDEILVHIDQNFFATAVGISIVAAYLSTSITEQLRLSFTMRSDHKVTSSPVWYMALGVGMGTVCLWGMHVVALFAVRLQYKSNGEFIPLTYHAGNIIGALIVVTIGSSLGLFIASFDPMYLKSKVELLEEYLPGGDDMSLRQLSAMGTGKLLMVIFTNHWGMFVLGGTVNAVCYLAMHLVGMRSLCFQGHFAPRPGVMLGWLLLIEVLLMIAYAICFRVLNLFPDREWLRIGCGVGLGLSSAALHVLGMLSYNVVHDQTVPKTVTKLDVTSQMVVYPTIISLLVCIAVLALMNIMDLRAMSVKLIAKRAAKKAEFIPLPVLDALNKLAVMKTKEEQRLMSLFSWTKSLRSVFRIGTTSRSIVVVSKDFDPNEDLLNNHPNEPLV